MSVLAVNAVTDANGGNTATINSMTPTADSLQGFRNRILNGGMVIDQRNNGASVTPTTSGTYTLDRWKTMLTVASKFSVQRSTTAPTGFANSLLVTSLSAYSLGDDILSVNQPIEGLNVSDLDWGTANAKTVTLSFWVRSSLTGSFGGAITSASSGAFSYSNSYPFAYTISSANTWEQKTVVISGPTSGTFSNSTSDYLSVVFSLGAASAYSGTAGAWVSGTRVQPTGSVSLVSTNGATWYITGVQLEVGSVATPFERRPYGTELALCQRYCNVYGENAYSIFGSMGYAFSTTGFLSATHLPVEMRAVPTLSVSGNTRSNPDNVSITSATFNTSNSSKKIAVVEPAVASGLTSNRGYYWTANNDATARVIFSAEL
jgi:hypothetical protein